MSKNVRATAIVIISLLLILPTIKGTIGVATLRNNISQNWYNACVWLRENTPEPYPENAYYALSTSNSEASYNILSWWDYGHWIIRIAHRATIVSPTHQGSVVTYQGRDYDIFFFWTAQSEAEANSTIEGFNVRYIIVDKNMTEGKFYALVVEAQRNPSEINKLRPNSMIMRLWEGKTETWELIHQEGDVKIFERKGQNNVKS